MTGELQTRSATQAAHPRQDPHRTWHAPLPPADHAAGLARRATREVLRSWQLAHLEDAALLLVSELVTNSVRHAHNDGRMLGLRLEATGRWLRIEVQDGDSRWPQPGSPDGLDESGFGFVLVAALTLRWGVSDCPAGKAVWAELRI